MELRKAKEWIAFLLALALFFTVAWFGAKLLMPVRTAYGCLWDAIRREEPESVELMIVGSSMAYCDIAPAYLWEQTGLDAYVVAGPEQTLPISYYYIREACRTLGSWRLEGCTLFVTLEPCPMCTGAIIMSRLPCLVFGAREPQTGSVGSVIDLFQERYRHEPKVYGGILEDECAALLRGFFEAWR